MEDVPSSSNVEEMEEVVVEPRFKYERILADVKEGLDKSSSSCVAIHDRYIAIGFSSGEIRMYDHLGHEHFVNSFKRHKCAVTQIGFDAPGRYIISCANDSVVHIQGVGHDEYNESLKVMPAAKCVALGPTFSKNTGQRFITGSQNLITYEKGFLGKYRTGVSSTRQYDYIVFSCYSKVWIEMEESMLVHGTITLLLLQMTVLLEYMTGKYICDSGCTVIL